MTANRGYKMGGIRLRFMDLLYAAVIGNSLQELHPAQIDLKFLFSMLMILIILEDFFLYYADVAPENSGHEGFSFWGMGSEIALLSCWYFAFQAFVGDSWNFALFLCAFWSLKTFAGFVNCAVSKCLLSIKFFRETLFLAPAGVILFAYFESRGASPLHAPQLLILIATVWAVQTFLWWALTKLFRTREGKRAVLAMTSTR